MKFYPVILAVKTESRMVMKIIYDSEDYAGFCMLYKKPGTEIIELPTLEAKIDELRHRFKKRYQKKFR